VKKARLEIATPKTHMKTAMAQDQTRAARRCMARARPHGVGHGPHNKRRTVG